jgi:hypothetical protein
VYSWVSCFLGGWDWGGNVRDKSIAFGGEGLFVCELVLSGVCEGARLGG